MATETQGTDEGSAGDKEDKVFRRVIRWDGRERQAQENIEDRKAPKRPIFTTYGEQFVDKKPNNGKRK